MNTQQQPEPPVERPDATTACGFSAAEELSQFRAAYEMLRDLDHRAQIRAIDWLTSRFRSEQVIPEVPF